MPLDDVRVLDLTRYTAGPFCTRVLADYGADVVKIESPDGDPARRLPPFHRDEPGPERSGTFLFLNTNKRSVVLDLKAEEGRARLLRLAERADAVVENFKPGTMERLGIGYDELRAANPRLVLTSLTNFGQDGPYRDFEAADITLYGMGGPMQGAGDVDHEPVKTAGRMTGYHAGLVAALATSLALRAAGQRGEGEHVDVSIFETATQSIDIRMIRLLGHQYTGRVATRPGRVSAVAQGVYPCADGFFMLGPRPATLPRVIRMIGRADLLEQPDWATPEARSHPDRITEFDAYLLPWLLERTKREIRAACEEFGVTAGPVNTVADLLEDENFVAREFFQRIDHPETGPLVYPGYHFRLHRGEPMPERRRAPLLGEHTDEVLAELAERPATPTAPPVRRRGPRAPARLPLEGVRIVDFTVVLAGPYGAMQLADWGAEVIRVESLQHFAAETRGAIARPPADLVDAMTNQGTGYPDGVAGEHPWNRYSSFNSHSRNKRSMTVDLTRPEGQEALERLVAISDGLIENNLQANIEKLGITWERLSKINPKLVMLRIPAFGLDGPYRGYRTFGHHMEALAGHPAIRSYPDLSLEYAPLGIPSDAASGMGSALAFTMGLRQRDRTGEGLMVELATAENFVPLIGEFVMDYTMNGRLWSQMGNDHWWLAPHNVYRSRGEDAWVTIAVRSEREWRALCEAMRREDLAADERFADMASRHANRRALDAVIAEWTRDRDAHWIMHRLQREGIAAGPVLNEPRALDDPHHQTRGFFREIAHPEATRRARPPATRRCSGRTTPTSIASCSASRRRSTAASRRRATSARSTSPPSSDAGWARRGRGCR
jgi:crotonobetainyl-CoA:carnitine CoA-transferase CaiB-like acyl-CoA transferase